MQRRDNFFIINKYHYNPTSNEASKKQPLPVLMLDKDGDPLEFDTKESADEFVGICNINSNQGFGYEVKEIGTKYLKIQAKSIYPKHQKQLLKD